MQLSIKMLNTFLVMIVFLGEVVPIACINIFLGMNKILYIPGQRYSTLTLQHDFNTFETNLYDIEITLNLTQVINIFNVLLDC